MAKKYKKVEKHVQIHWYCLLLYLLLPEVLIVAVIVSGADPGVINWVACQLPLCHQINENKSVKVEKDDSDPE